MDDLDFEIDFEDAGEAQEAGFQLPLNFLQFGQLENDDLKVYIKQDVYKALEKLSNSDTTKELGSILLGNYCQEASKTHLVISDYVEAKYTDASAATLTFTHKTWDYVHAQHKAKCPDKKIIGWQHTHPNYGIFLSNYDMFIQENFFNLPFQTAYVIDPIQNLRGFFQWKNGKVEKLRGYYIYDEVGTPIKIEQTKVAKEAPVKTNASAPIWTSALIALLCLTSLALGISNFALNRKLNQQQLQISALATQPEVIVPETTEPVQTQPVSDQQGVRFISYQVQSGDTLIAICQSYGIDYYANRNLIRGINGLENTSHLYVGQILLLPVIE